MGGQEGSDDPNQPARMPTEEDMAAMGNRCCDCLCYCWGLLSRLYV